MVLLSMDSLYHPLVTNGNYAVIFLILKTKKGLVGAAFSFPVSVLPTGPIVSPSPAVPRLLVYSSTVKI